MTDTVPQSVYQEAIREGDEWLSDAVRSRDAASRLYGALEDLIAAGRAAVAKHNIAVYSTDVMSKLALALDSAAIVLRETETVYLRGALERELKRRLELEEEVRELKDARAAVTKNEAPTQ
jgi:hypothetical protein